MRDQAQQAEPKREENEISRRDFIKGAGLIAGGVAVGSTTLIAAAPAPQAATPTPKPATAPVVLEVLDPTGELPPQPVVGISPRLTDLAGKTIALVDNTKTGVNYLLDSLGDLLKAKYPTVTIARFRKTRYSDDQPDLLKEVAAKADAFVLAMGD